ncbi:copper resistance CopC/CopD family protein [Catenuloplanes atrovinosus]|uniref:Copper transport protein n=1 Tax=Catenuloplanes atrovinosus TaxID=137266 RepID=A0AAE3YVZ1_9ACTN|nr:copper resistance protein CopC [Catenuloplanes atrovinosus]MDR7280909.1 copper transport protein [Catenuloplanes atrovinosus]
MRWVRLIAAMLLGALAVLIGPVSPASAHAVVVDTVPARGSVVGSAPATVTITFSEAVRLVPGKVKVVAPDGTPVTGGEPTLTGAVMSIPIAPAERPLGTYTVSYRVVSADSHPVGGGFSYSVGARSTFDGAVTGDAVHAGVTAGISIAKYVGYVGLTLLVGPALLMLSIWPRRLLRTPAARRGPRIMMFTGAGLVALSAIAAVWLQAPYAYGGGPLDATASGLGEVLRSQFGLAHLGRLVALALAVPLLTIRGFRGRGAVLALVATAGMLTWPLSGHPIASRMPVVTVLADLAHLGAMAVWLGGLVALAAFLLRRADARELRVILPVWSRWAALAVYCLIAGGVLQVMVEVGAVSQLVTTRFGQLILAKTALLAVVLAVAGAARLLVRRIVAGTATGWTARLVPGGAPVTWLRRSVAAELVVTMVVLAASAVLVQTTPSRNVGEEAPVVVPETYSETLTSPIYTLQFEIYPVQRGEHNTLHGFVYTPEGKPIPIEEFKVSLALPSAGLEPIDAPMAILDESHGLGPLNFPLPGEWTVKFTIRISEIDQATVSAVVNVP